MNARQETARLILVGGGHSHLFVLERLARGRLGGARVVLVSPHPFHYYSGMIPGLTAGMYRPADLAFDLAAIAGRAGAEFRLDAVRGVDAASRRLKLASGTTLDYDFASFDIGSGVAHEDDIPGVREHAIRVKPIHEATRIAERVGERLGNSGRRVTLAGAGAAGVEMAFGLARWGAVRGVAVTLLEAGAHLLPDYPPAAVARASALLAGRGIELRTSAAVREVCAASAILADGEEVPHEALVWVTGPAAPALFRDSGLPIDAGGYLLVHDTLVVAGHGNLFGAGDCIGFASGQRVPKAGVFAVRQGPRLAANIAAALDGDFVLPYRAQRHWLSLLNTADGCAIAARGRFSAYGVWCYRLKDWIDRRFVRRFQRLR